MACHVRPASISKLSLPAPPAPLQGQAIEVSVHAVAMAAALATLKHGGGLQPVPSARQAVLVRQAFVQAVWPALVEFDREKRIPGMPASAQAAWQLARSYTAGGHIAWRSGGWGRPGCGLPKHT